MADIELGGMKVNPVVLVIAGAGVLLLLIVSRGGGGGGAVTPTSAGSMAEEYNQLLKESQDATAQKLQEQKDTFDAALKLNADKTAAAATAAAVAQQSKLDTATSGITAALAKLTDLIASLAASITDGAKKAVGKFPLDPEYDGPSPDASTIAKWAADIGLPLAWGQNFVDKFGRLPDSIPQLETWRGIIGERNSSGAWCIGGECV